MDHPLNNLQGLFFQLFGELCFNTVLGFGTTSGVLSGTIEGDVRYGASRSQYGILVSKRLAKGTVVRELS